MSNYGDQIWATLEPIFMYMNSPEFCEMFYLIPAEWEGEKWVATCQYQAKA